MMEIENGYDLLVRRHGAKILSVTRIVRRSPERPYSQQNSDFSVNTIKRIIMEGEKTGLEELKSFDFNERQEPDAEE
jgi:hypothetical protein